MTISIWDFELWSLQIRSNAKLERICRDPWKLDALVYLSENETSKKFIIKRMRLDALYQNFS